MYTACAHKDRINISVNTFWCIFLWKHCCNFIFLGPVRMHESFINKRALVISCIPGIVKVADHTGVFHVWVLVFMGQTTPTAVFLWKWSVRVGMWMHFYFGLWAWQLFFLWFFMVHCWLRTIPYVCGHLLPSQKWTNSHVLKFQPQYLTWGPFPAFL